jgi:predicted Fe-Mo cluster-binding NifX family protein
MQMSEVTRIAVPSLAEGGLEAQRSAHFGQCDCFTVVEVGGGKVITVESIVNPPHGEGGCLSPVSLLASANVDSLVVAGMGMRPLAGFASAGIRVYFENETLHVGSVVEKMLAGLLPEMDPGSACSGGCHH